MYTYMCTGLTLVPQHAWAAGRGSLLGASACCPPCPSVSLSSCRPRPWLLLQMNAGFALVCSSYPTSDLVLLTHQEEAVGDFAIGEMQVGRVTRETM